MAMLLCVCVCVCLCARVGVFGRGEGLCVRCSCLYYLASLHLHLSVSIATFPSSKHFVSTQSSSPRSPHSPRSPRDASKLSRQAGSANQEHNEKVLLNLEEVKVSGRRNTFTVLKNRTKKNDCPDLHKVTAEIQDALIVYKNPLLNTGSRQLISTLTSLVRECEVQDFFESVKTPG